jgi:hypothetical protein
MSTDIFVLSDLFAGVQGALFSSVFCMPGGPGMQAVQSLVVSVLARMASTKMLTRDKLSMLDNSQKNQLLVAIMSGAAAYYRRSGVGKGALSGVSIDLLAQHTVTLIGLDDKPLFSL